MLEKLVKRQGDGGIINLDQKKVEWLGLQSPHSMRLINGQYWVQNSGDLSIAIFDKNWEKVKDVTTGGFGRGVAFSEADDCVYVGLSATRKRYLKLLPTNQYHSNRVQVLDIKTATKQQEISIPNIEQLDNVYILNDYLLEKLSRFSQK